MADEGFQPLAFLQRYLGTFGSSMPDVYGPDAPNPVARPLRQLARGFMAPGQAYQSTDPIPTEQMIGPAQDISSLARLGGFGGTGPGGVAVGAGPTWGYRAPADVLPAKSAKWIPPRDRPPANIFAPEEITSAPSPANDPNLIRADAPRTYRAAQDKQMIDRLVDKDTHVGDYIYWNNIAEKEGHMGSSGNPSGIVASTNYSRGGKSAVYVMPDGRRYVSHDGKLIVKERPQ